MFTSNEYNPNNPYSLIPRRVGSPHSDSADCMCDYCSTRLRKHDGYVNVYSYQFMSPLGYMTNDQKDEALANHGMIRGEDPLYGQAFHGKVLPPRNPFGKHKHLMDTGGAIGPQYINPYRVSTAMCEGVCCSDVCREYGDALERYMQCKEKCPSQSPAAVLKHCGPPPVNPAKNNCKMSQSLEQEGWYRWLNKMDGCGCCQPDKSY